MKELLKEIKKNKDEGWLAGFKISFEDEGATLEDVLNLNMFSKASQVPLYLKIGGCEAKTDILNCKNNFLDGVIAPMIESNFALEKFISACNEVGYDGKRFMNLETKNCIENLDLILNSFAAKELKGMTIGRSDLAASYGLTKSEVDCPELFRIIEKTLKTLKVRGITATMGGNITSGSKDNVSRLYDDNLIEKIETRNVIIKLTPKTIKDLSEIINEALFLETMILSKRKSDAEFLFKKNEDRIEKVRKRLEI